MDAGWICTNEPTEITLTFHSFPLYLSQGRSDSLLPQPEPLCPVPFPISLSLCEKVYKLLDLMASRGLHLPSEDSHVHVKILNKHVRFSPVSLSYVN